MKTLIDKQVQLTSIPTPNDVDLRGKLSILFGKCLPRKLAKLVAMQKLWPAVKDSDRCLDIGTSNGGFTYYYSQKGRWTFLEIDGDYFQTAQKILKGEFVVGDLVEHLKAQPGYELVAAIDSLCYTADPASVLKSIHTNLAPGGKLFIAAIEKRDTDPLIKLRTLLGIEDALGIVTNPRLASMTTLLKGAGFSTVESHYYFGPLSQVFQTFIDCFFIQRGEQGNRLTMDLGKSASPLKVMHLLCPLTYLCSLIVNFLDFLLPIFPRYAYVLVATKAGGSRN